MSIWPTFIYGINCFYASKFHNLAIFFYIDCSILRSMWKEDLQVCIEAKHILFRNSIFFSLVTFANVASSLPINFAVDHFTSNDVVTIKDEELLSYA
jgi:hypothetical protein